MPLPSFARPSAVIIRCRRVTLVMREAFALLLLVTGVSECRMEDPELL